MKKIYATSRDLTQKLEQWTGRQPICVIYAAEVGLALNTAAVFVTPTVLANLYVLGAINTLETVNTAISVVGAGFTGLALFNFILVFSYKALYWEGHEGKMQEIKRAPGNAAVTLLPIHDPVLNTQYHPLAGHALWDNTWQQYGVPLTMVACLASLPFMIAGNRYLANFWLSHLAIASPAITVLSLAVIGAAIVFDLAIIGAAGFSYSRENERSLP